jgi:hypothetical protein
MSDKTCKTCRWWQEDEDHRVKLTNAKKCANPKVAFAKQQDASENYEPQTNAAPDEPNRRGPQLEPPKL